MSKKTREIILFVIALMAAGVIFLGANTDDAKKYEHGIVFLGDSIIANNSGSIDVTDVMKERLDMDIFNGALGGSSMSFVVGNHWETVSGGQWSMVKLAQAIYTDDWTSQLAGAEYAENYRYAVGQVLDYFYERIYHLSQVDFSEVDILFIEHGTNDYNCGQIIESEEDPFAEDTYAGALRTTLSLLQEKYPEMRIILVSPTYCEFIYQENAKCYETDFGGGVLDDYVAAQKSVAEEYGVEWIDMYHESGIWSDTIDIYTYDKLHLTEEGKMLIGNKLAEYLKENPSKPAK